MIERGYGVVTSIIGIRPGLTEIMVNINGKEEKALNYNSITGNVVTGNRVILNTTAVSKNLGTGGYHFVMAVIDNNECQAQTEGHIMKLRYSPLQIKVLSVEEKEHPQNNLYKKVKDLEGLPVVVGTLHSMLAPVAAAIKHKSGAGIKIAYLMTDGAALPIWLSSLAHELKMKRLVDETITCGHAFGGDYEAINVYSGLIWAKANGADVVIAAMGPGIVGSSSEFGHTALEQGQIVNAVNVLGGRAVAVPRISMADARERHRGLSHHTATALGKVALSRCAIPVPAWSGGVKALIYKQLKESGIFYKHNIVETDADSFEEIMDYYGLSVTTMGRTVKDDPEFFRTACAAGIYVSGLLQPGFNETGQSGPSPVISAQD
ncbi:MAG: DUF3866 family protein [Desulfocucumaceae bacterium]